jgi:Ca2+-binding RTX toxin-like protein
MPAFQNIQPYTSTGALADVEGMLNWLSLPIAEIKQGRYYASGNDIFYERPYMLIKLLPTGGGPMYLKLEGNFTFGYVLTSSGEERLHVMAGSVIDSVTLVDWKGDVFATLSGMTFPLNSNKTSTVNEPINVFVNTFRSGESPDPAMLMSGADSINGSTRFDINETLRGYGGNDTMNGYGGNDVLLGGTGQDLLVGGAGADNLYGEGGNDTLVFGFGDYHDGGEGFDTVKLFGQTVVGRIIPSTLDIRGYNFSNIEAFSISGGDIVVDSSQVGAAGYIKTIYGGSTGGDFLNIRAANPNAGAVIDMSGVRFFDWVDSGVDYPLADTVRITGTNYADRIEGSAVAEVILAGEGDNVVRGNGGNDTIQGGFGRDVFRGGDGSDTLRGSYGNDILVDDDTGSVDAKNDVLDGGAGNDSLYVGLGFNSLIGGEGFDYVRYDLYSTGIKAYLDSGFGEGCAFLEIEGLVGSRFYDTLRGNQTNNVLYGLGGNDVLSGLDGADRLIGGTETDRLYGGKGNDMFLFYAADLQRGIRDYIYDFDRVAGNSDAIWFQGIAAAQVKANTVGDGVLLQISGIAGGVAEVYLASTTLAEYQAGVLFA